MASILRLLDVLGLEDLNVFVNDLIYPTFSSSVSVTERHVKDLNFLSNIYVLKVIVCDNLEILIY